MEAKPIYKNIIGAPFKIGDIVTIIGVEDYTFDEIFKGKTGEVYYFEYSCGCGQSFPADPMIGIKFENGEIEEFWKEELKKENIIMKAKLVNEGIRDILRSCIKK